MSEIYTEKDNEKALELVEELMDKDPEPSSLEGKVLVFLVEIIQRFEEKHYKKCLNRRASEMNNSARQGNIENHVTSLELSKELRKVGFPQKSQWIWDEHYEEPTVFHSNEVLMYQRHMKSVYAAPLATELLEVLPNKVWIKKRQYDVRIHILSLGDYLIVCHHNDFKNYTEAYDKTLPDALAKMYIYLKKEKLI